ncbi:sporulation protein YqfD [Psychrobacillus sp. Sa2BUA9]|uniref:Sporulation protein YqfD n=1 Tax=Psychrobacillus faecigallinarum TaxID=2762235 RepID=A0ABR8R7W4_9BACI|nr:sporulation protein YqfD [Psychrobacillus faecigallinarum]MBD7943836.1 sporulation protein YqfD [Psychrobacillus faecigallinarum]
MSKQLVRIQLASTTDQFVLFQKLLSHEIEVYRVYSTEDSLFFSIQKKDLKQFRKIRKTLKLPVKLKDEATSGTISIYSYSIIGVIFFFIIPLIFAQFIWKVNIDSYTPESNIMITEQLKEMKIKERMLISSLPSEQEIRQKLLLKHKEFSWIHFTQSGSTLTVTPMLAPVTNEREVKNAPPSHLIAKRSGVITDFELVKGVRAVEKNTAVKKGDILVNGFVTQGDKRIITSAEGKVYASYWIELNFELPRKVTIIKPTTREVLIQKKTDDKNDFWKEIAMPRFLQPYFKAGYVQGSEVVSYDLNEESVKHLVRPLLFQKIMNELPIGTQILEDKVLQMSIENDKVKGKILLLINENIATPQVIPQGDDT